jgi:excisionase family DNA binding protein
MIPRLEEANVGTLSTSKWSQNGKSDGEDEAGTSPTPHPSALMVPGERLVLTVAEAGALLGVSRAFAYELVARGELPVIRLGRRIVIPKTGLIQMIDTASRIAETAL